MRKSCNTVFDLTVGWLPVLVTWFSKVGQTLGQVLYSENMAINI